MACQRVFFVCPVFCLLTLKDKKTHTSHPKKAVLKFCCYDSNWWWLERHRRLAGPTALPCSLHYWWSLQTLVVKIWTVEIITSVWLTPAPPSPLFLPSIPFHFFLYPYKKSRVLGLAEAKVRWIKWMSSKHLKFSTLGRKYMTDRRACITKYVSNAVIKVINLIDKKTSKLLMSPHQQWG